MEIYIFRTDSITDERRGEIPNGTSYDKCEICDHVTTHLTDDEDVKFVKFYSRYEKALCDQCVDWLNGNQWVDRNGEPLKNKTSERQFKWMCEQQGFWR